MDIDKFTQNLAENYVKDLDDMEYPLEDKVMIVEHFKNGAKVIYDECQKVWYNHRIEPPLFTKLIVRDRLGNTSLYTARELWREDFFEMGTDWWTEVPDFVVSRIVA